MPDAKKKEEKKKESGSKISNTEWGMVILLLWIVDGIQFGLDWIGIPFIATIGTVANRFIDLVVGLAWPTYLHLRGVSLKSVKTAGSIILTFFLEEIPDVDALPLWGANGLFVMATVKAEEKIKEETGVDVEKFAALAEAAEGGSVKAEAGGEGGAFDEYADAMGQESDERDAASQAEPPESSAEAGDLGDEDHEMSDEEADELGRESDEKLKEKEGETAEDKAKREEEEEKKKKKGDDKKKPQAREEGFGFGGGRSGRRGNQTGEASDPLNLRGGADERRQSDKESARLHSNLLDLSLSYGARKKKREADENLDETGFPE